MVKDLTQRGAVLIDPDFKSRDDMFRWVAQDAQSKGLVTSADVFYEALVAREEQISTEVETGIALPHARAEQIQSTFIYLILSHEGVRFTRFGARVRIIFLIGISPQDRNYLNLMATIARLLQKREFRSALQDADSPQKVLSLLEQYGRGAEAVEEGTRGMHCLVLALNNSSSMETAMELAIELGIKGAQMFEATNVAAKVALRFPFLSLISGKGELLASRVMMGYIPDEKIAHRLLDLLRKEGIDIAKPGAGMLMTFPLGVVFGGIDADYL